MRRLGLATLVALVAFAAPHQRLVAQDSAPAVQEDPLFSMLFPPELIMQHRRAINLTDAQRDAITGMIADLQSRVVRLQWDMLDEMQQLTEIMSATKVDLDRALDQLDHVLDTEKEIKQAHLRMLVRIKNLLSAEQQATLERLRESAAPGA